MTSAAPRLYLCLRQDTPVASGLAALATVAQRHGLPLTVSGLRKLAGLGEQTVDAILLLFAAKKCGFDATPLEGEFDQLPQVATPAIVTFRGDRFQVLYEIDETSALVGDPANGDVRRLSKDEFCRDWTGDIFQLLPDPTLVAEARETLRRLESPWIVALSLTGIAPTSAPRLLFLLTFLLWIGGLFVARPLSLLSGGCLLASLWMAAFPRGCAKCGATASLTGALPLPWLGAAYYALLTAATLFAAPFPARIGIFAAGGAHLALAGILLRRRIACYPCLAIATMIFSAAGLALSSAGLELWIFLPTALATWAVVHFAASLERAQSQSRKFDLAASVFRQPFAVPGCARLVLYSRSDCPICVYFKTVIRPMLEECFGDALVIEDRDAASLKLRVPIFFVTGSLRIGLASLETDQMLPRLSSAIQAALDPASGTVGGLGGFELIGFDEISAGGASAK